MARQRRKSGNPTIMDVAQEAGVSAITVSRTLRTPDQVSIAARAKVTAAIRKLDYRPDPAAKALASAQSEVIGVLVPSVTNAVFSDTLNGIYTVADTGPYTIQLANTRYSDAQEARLLRQLLSLRPAGLIVTGIDQSDEVRDLLQSARCPVVQIMETGPQPLDMMVGFSHYDAAKAAAQHLLTQGYRRIGYLGARRDARSRRRLAGFSDALEQAGQLDTMRIIDTDRPASLALGADLLGQALDSTGGCDAVLCNNDVLAIGALFESARRGVAVPDAMGICGFNDIEMMSSAYPSLTSVATPRTAIGTQAMDWLMARIAGDQIDTPVLDLGFTLIPRDSTRRGGRS